MTAAPTPVCETCKSETMVQIGDQPPQLQHHIDCAAPKPAGEVRHLTTDERAAIDRAYMASVTVVEPKPVATAGWGLPYNVFPPSDKRWRLLSDANEPKPEAVSEARPGDCEDCGAKFVFTGGLDHEGRKIIEFEADRIARELLAARAQIARLTSSFNDRVRVIEMQLHDKEQLAATISSLTKRLAGVEANGRRYEWLREGDNDEEVLRVFSVHDDEPSRPFDLGVDRCFLPRLDKLDAAIDRAMALAQQREG